MIHGTVATYNAKKGYGTIRYTEAGATKEVFFHQSALKHAEIGHIAIGQALTFQIAAGAYGEQAVRLAPDV